jgi:excisionase family DNA binding protein
MSLKVLTTEDLEAFKTELLFSIRTMLQESKQASDAKRWIKAKEFAELMSVSDATLQRLRISGEVEFTMFGGRYYYRVPV